MTERERLIELLRGRQAYGKTAFSIYPISNEEVADYLLENGVIVPPVRIWQKVYRISGNFRGEKIYEGVVDQIIAYDDRETKFYVYGHPLSAVAMARYIDAEKLKDAFHTDTEHLQSRDEHLFDLIMFEIDETPTADVAEVKHGEWKPTKIPAYFGGVIYECSLCGAKDGDHTKILGRYCWRCGAKMDGGKTE